MVAKRIETVAQSCISDFQEMDELSILIGGGAAWDPVGKLALVGYEGLVIVAVLVIIFLWGPQKLPEMAKSIGLAKREFDKAAKEVSMTASTSTGTSENVAQDPLIVAAKSLGITTEGKTKEDIAKEIADRTSK